MATPENIKRTTVKALKEEGYTFYFMIPTLKEKETRIKGVPVIVSAVQLSAAVLWANRKDEVIVSLFRGRNGRKTARVIEIPNF